MYIKKENITLEIVAERFFINDILSKKIYEINQSIYQILLFFSTENDIDHYIKKVATESNLDYEKVKIVIMPFFEKLIKSKFIVSAKHLSVNLNSNVEISKNSIIDNRFKVVEILQNKLNIEYVLLVEDVNDEKYILKMVLNNSENFEKKKKILENEYCILQSLYNENIVQSKEYCLKDNFYFVILEYLQDYKTLAQYKDFDNTDKQMMIKEILMVYKYLHDNDILHGDIHFKNILVKADSIKIIDFGLSQKNNEVSRKGGIHHFIPPERLGENSFNKLSSVSTKKGEVYQLGLIIYYIINEKLPFSSVTFNQLRNEIIQGVQPESKEVLKIWDYLGKCLAVNPEERFLDANDMYQNWLQYEKIR